KDLEESRIKARQKASGPGAGDASLPNKEERPDRVVITRTVYIEPGLYRLAKSHETAQPCAGLGFLEDIGITVVEETKVRPLAQTPAQAPAPAQDRGPV